GPRRVLHHELHAGRPERERRDAHRDLEVAPQREPVASPGAVLHGHVGDRPDRLPGADHLAGLQMAVRGATVAGYGVPVVALLGPVDEAVAAARLALARRRAAVAGGGVAVVALLARIDDSVPAHLEVARGAAAVAGDDVSVVALLARLEDAVPAGAGR